MRTETPALNTGISPDAFGLSVSCTLLVLDHANPPSRNGETVVGRYGKLISPIAGPRVAGCGSPRSRLRCDYPGGATGADRSPPR